MVKRRREAGRQRGKVQEGERGPLNTCKFSVFRPSNRTSRRSAMGTTHPEGVGHRLEVCDTDSLIKESKDSTADWSG